MCGQRSDFIKEGLNLPDEITLPYPILLNLYKASFHYAKKISYCKSYTTK